MDQRENIDTLCLHLIMILKVMYIMYTVSIYSRVTCILCIYNTACICSLGFSTIKQSRTTQLSDKHHWLICSVLDHHATKWFEIGRGLNFEEGELKNIQCRPLLMQSAPNSWLETMISEWLKRAPGDSRGECTVESLQSSLRESGLGALADSEALMNLKCQPQQPCGEP